MMSGSDLDGDQYWVCWDPALLPPATAPEAATVTADALGNVPAMVHKKADVKKPPKDAKHSVLRVLGTSVLGPLTDLHKRLADRDGAYSVDCMKLAELASLAVDAPKTGVRVNIPSRLREKRADRPEWSLRDEKERRYAPRPNTLLQDLANTVQEVQDKLVANRDDFVGVHLMAPAQEAQRAREWLLNQCPNHWHTLHARGVKIHAVYNRSLRTLMDRFGTASEAELITTELL
jgi:hypothetical protein